MNLLDILLVYHFWILQGTHFRPDDIYNCHHQWKTFLLLKKHKYFNNIFNKNNIYYQIILISINLFLYINLPLNSYSSYEAGGGTAYANAGATGWLALDHELPLLCFVIGLESDLSSSLEFNFPPTLNCLYMFSLKSLPYHWIS